MQVQDYWQSRYHARETGWDMGQVSPPLAGFMQNWRNHNSRILIPGAGNAYEAQWLHEQGFTQVHVLDVAPTPLQNLKKRCPAFPDEHLHQEDFFNFKGNFDLILEQTFFCALPPEQRDVYVQKTHELLKPAGQLAGVLFTFPLTEKGPPYGGSYPEYRKLFIPKFKVVKLAPCYNSIAPRSGNEAFVQFIRK